MTKITSFGFQEVHRGPHEDDNKLGEGAIMVQAAENKAIGIRLTMVEGLFEIQGFGNDKGS